MIRRLLICSVVGTGLMCSQGVNPSPPPEDPKPARLPNGKLQSEAILKEEYEKNLEDSAELLKLAEDLKAELEKNDTHILSLGSLKKLDQIDKLSKRLRTRIRH